MMIPGGFPSLRPVQETMAGLIEAACRSGKQSVQCHCAPTGTGKTLAYITGCWRSGARTAVLTQTKALQSQILRDFRREAKDLRGAANFRCARWGTCERGRSRGCSAKDCPYLGQFDEARVYKIIVTNYAMWAAAVMGAAPLGEIRAIVCDEAHLLDSALDSAFSIRLTQDEARSLHLPSPPERSDIGSLLPHLANLDMLEQRTEEDALRLQRNKRVWSAMLGMPKATPVVLREDQSSIVIGTLWPAPWFRYAILSRARTVVLSSATITDQQVQTLFGLGREEFESYDYPCPFDPAKGPVYLLPRGRMNHAAQEEAVLRVFKTALDIAKARPGSRGIIHTVSYARAQKLMEYAAASDIETAMRLTDSIDAYMASPDAVLVSPSVGTGHDFPDDLCRWQVVIKAPYPNLGDALVRLRSEADPNYMQMVMTANLIQICGRNVRHEDDYGETFVLDTNACEALSQTATGLIPDWLASRVRRISAAPKAKHNNDQKEQP